MLTSDRKLTFVSVVAIIFYYYEWILFTWVLSAGRAVKEIGFAVRENIANSKKGIKYEGMHMNTFTLVHESIEHAALRSLDQFLSTALDKACAFLDSPIGFYHFVESDQETPSLQQWSARTLKKFCRAEGEGLHHGIDWAGVRVDCVRERKPVIHIRYIFFLKCDLTTARSAFQCPFHLSTFTASIGIASTYSLLSFVKSYLIWLSANFTRGRKHIV